MFAKCDERKTVAVVATRYHVETVIGTMARSRHSRLGCQVLKGLC